MCECEYRYCTYILLYSVLKYIRVVLQWSSLVITSVVAILLLQTAFVMQNGRRLNVEFDVCPNAHWKSD